MIKRITHNTNDAELKAKLEVFKHINDAAKVIVAPAKKDYRIAIQTDSYTMFRTGIRCYLQTIDGVREIDGGAMNSFMQSVAQLNRDETEDAIRAVITNGTFKSISRRYSENFDD